MIYCASEETYIEPRFAGTVGTSRLLFVPESYPASDPRSDFTTNISESAADWPLPNYDHSSTRATFASKINSGNVNQLTEAWTYELRDSGCGGYSCTGAAATTPIVIDGTVYIGDLLTNVHALNLETGNRRWMVTMDTRVIGPSGVVVGLGKVFANKRGRQIAAYDLENGDELWATSLGGHIYIQPTMADGKVLAATAGAGGPGSRGKLYALDQETGDILWSFDTIESDDLWGHPEINSGGGTWYPPSVDIANRVAYWGISNPYPSRERSAIPPVQAGQETTNGPTQFSTSTPAS